MTLIRFVIVVFVVTIVGMTASADAQGRGAAAAQSATPRAGAPIDLTGNWVAVVTEDWRWRMVTPPKGDYASIPLTPEGKRVADTWDPAKDEAAGEQCRAYGAPGLMRGPTRLRISWLDDATVKVETDYGMQTRRLQFQSEAGDVALSWQGFSIAQWVFSSGGRGAGAQRSGSLKTVTTALRPGYLRKNGVPYSATTVLTEFWDVHALPSGERLLVITTKVDDPVNLQLPWVTSLHFKSEADGSKWDPTPCAARF
jgi:hypothetical protein